MDGRGSGGQTLAEVVRRDGPLTGAALARFAGELAAALAGLHRAGVVHGGLGPDRVVLGADGWHLTAVATPGPDGPDAGVLSCTAPEVLGGTPAGAAGDVFGWGCLVGYAGTGRSPFGAGSRAAVLTRLLDGRPVVDGLPEPLRSAVAQALAREPADRPTAVRLHAGCDRDGLQSAGRPVR